MEHFAEGMRLRTRAVEDARRDLARARLSAPALPTGQDWTALDPSNQRQLLRGALGVVWIRKRGGRGRAGIRIIAAGFEPSEFGPADWPDVDMPGEIGVVGA